MWDRAAVVDPGKALPEAVAADSRAPAPSRRASVLAGEIRLRRGGRVRGPVDLYAGRVVEADVEEAVGNGEQRDGGVLRVLHLRQEGVPRGDVGSHVRPVSRIASRPQAVGG